ncbi:hypothetical protein BDQ17DRAFT_1193658, partial [Cyathus striatus]
NGGRTLSAFNASKRCLTYAEECVLVEFIVASADRACPLGLQNIEEHANQIIAGR